MRYFWYYLIAINILGFIVFAINIALYHTTADKQIDKAVTIICLLGGAPGIFISMLLFERVFKKDVMMSRVFLIVCLVIQIIIILLIAGAKIPFISGLHSGLQEKWNSLFDTSNGVIRGIVSFVGAMISFFSKKWVWIYLIIINILTFAVYAVDKLNAIEHRGRIRIVTLLGLAFIGGTVGALLAMYILRHKTQKDYFTWGVPLIMIMHIFVIYFVFR